MCDTSLMQIADAMVSSGLRDAGYTYLNIDGGWWDPSAFTQGLAAMQWTGLWAMPAIIKALNDDFGVVAWSKLDAQGTPATFLGGWPCLVGAKGKNVQASKDFVKWLWLDKKGNHKVPLLHWSISIIDSRYTLYRLADRRDTVPIFTPYASARTCVALFATDAFSLLAWL